MRIKKSFRILLLLVAVMLLGATGCKNTSKDLVNHNSKEQFTKAVEKIMEFYEEGYEGELVDDDEEYSKNEYGKFVALIDVEKKYYLKVSDSVDYMNEKLEKMVNSDLSLKEPKDIVKVKEFDQVANKIEKYFNNWVQDIQ